MASTRHRCSQLKPERPSYDCARRNTYPDSMSRTSACSPSRRLVRLKRNARRTLTPNGAPADAPPIGHVIPLPVSALDMSHCRYVDSHTVMLGSGYAIASYGPLCLGSVRPHRNSPPATSSELRDRGFEARRCCTFVDRSPHSHPFILQFRLHDRAGLDPQTIAVEAYSPLTPARRPAARAVRNGSTDRFLEPLPNRPAQLAGVIGMSFTHDRITSVSCWQACSLEPGSTCCLRGQRQLPSHKSRPLP